MSDTSAQMPKQPLGLGAILSETFSIFFKNIITVMILGCVPGAIGFVVKLLLLGAQNTVDIATGSEVQSVSAALIAPAVDMVIYGLMTALVVQMAYDAKLGRKRSIGEYFSSAIPLIIPLALISIVVGIIMFVGFLALVVPGIWLIGVLAATMPIAVIERAGFKSIARSAELTKEYRWPIIGTVIVVGIIASIIGAIGGVIIYLPASLGLGIVGSAIGIILFTGITYGLNGIASALVYARLREIKDGVAVDDLAAVFD